MQIDVSESATVALVDANWISLGVVRSQFDNSSNRHSPKRLFVSGPKLFFLPFAHAQISRDTEGQPRRSVEASDSIDLVGRHSLTTN